MSYKDEAKRSREDKARRIVGAAHGGSVSRGDAKKIADAAVDRHRRHAYHLGPEEVAKDVKKDVKKDCYARGGRTKRGGRGDVNIIIDTAPKAPAVAPPMAALPPRPAMPPAPSPAPPAPPPGAAPGMPTRPGMPPMGGPPMRAAGGPVKMKYGAGSGEGRLEKISKRRGA